VNKRLRAGQGEEVYRPFCSSSPQSA